MFEQIKNTDNKKGQEFFAARHFEDVDDLHDGLDTPLLPIEEQDEEMVKATVDGVIENTENKGFNKVIMVSSNRQRALSTAKIVKDRIKEKRSDFRVRVIGDEHFSELKHGKLVLPDEYETGRRVEFLGDAWDAFWSETFTEDGEYKNINYKFGDPIKLSDGSFKYESIADSFSEYGESYRQLCLRYYQGLLEYLNKKDKMDNMKINSVLIAHSATLAIMNEIAEIADDIVNGGLEFETGELMKRCWQRYLERRKARGGGPSSIGYNTTLPLDHVDNPDLKRLLKKEIKYLKKQA